MTLIGMDVEAVHQLGKDLTTQAEQINQITSRIDQIVRQLPAIWKGTDAQRFVDWWTNQHRPSLRAAHDAIAGLGQSAKNNATEQTQASSVSGQGQGVAAVASGLATASTGASTAAVSSAAGSTSSATMGTAEGLAAVSAFRSAYEGKGVDTDGLYGNQCVDLFNQYNREVVGGPFIGTPVTGGARDLYEQFPASAAAYYDKIPSGQPAQAGDVAVWGATSGNQYGHVAMVISADSNALQVIQQNGFNPTGSAYVADHSYAGLLGYLRPKQFELST